MPSKTRAVKVSDIKGKKPWLIKQERSVYNTEKLEKKKTFLIVCEGQTEELYFKSFPVLTAVVKSIAKGCSKSTLVSCAQSLIEGEIYDEVWCVFDMDFVKGNKSQFSDFDGAIEKATKAGIKCAYSNDSFELWFVLHYLFLDQQQLRSFYNKKLSELWKINYEKEGKTRFFAKEIYNLLHNDNGASQQSAITNAKKLYQSQKEKKPHKQNPVTLVYQLVNELNKFIRQ